MVLTLAEGLLYAMSLYEHFVHEQYVLNLQLRLPELQLDEQASFVPNLAVPLLYVHYQVDLGDDSQQPKKQEVAETKLDKLK